MTKCTHISNVGIIAPNGVASGSRNVLRQNVYILVRFGLRRNRGWNATLPSCVATVVALQTRLGRLTGTLTDQMVPTHFFYAHFNGIQLGKFLRVRGNVPETKPRTQNQAWCAKRTLLKAEPSPPGDGEAVELLRSGQRDCLKN